MVKRGLAFIFILFAQHALAQIDFKFESSSKMAESINSEYEETAPVYNKSSSTLYFTRSLHPKNKGGVTGGQDIWKSVGVEGDFGTATNDLGPLNNRVNNSVIGAAASGDTLYLLSTYQKKIDLQQGFSSTILIGDKWQQPNQLNVSGLSFKSIYYSGFVSNSGKYLVISMEGRSSLGKEDLYLSINENGKWSRPIWLGDSINSAGFEISPFIYDDGKTLVFASNGHGGFGGCDIFYAHRLDSSWTNWSKPKNMGEVINSEGFDAYAFPVDDVMYYASNKSDSFSNIYTARNEGYYRIADTVRISFMMNTMKLTDVSLDVYDSEGTSIGTYLSGNEDVVKIPELKEGEDYTFTPSHDEVDIELFSPFILNEHGDPIAVADMQDGSMEIVPQSAEANNSMEVLPPPEFNRGMSGVFELDEIPVRNVFLALTDENGLPTQYSSTDAEGRFEFAETPDSINLYIHTITELEYLKQNGVVSYTDSNGVKLFRAILDTVGVFIYQELTEAEIAQLLMLQDEELESLDESTGVFKYNDLPREGVKLVLVDENDNVIEEVITDENGQFIFKKLKSESGFKIQLSEEADSELQTDGQVLFMDSDGNERNVMTSASGGAFVYKPLRPQISMGMAQMTEEDGSFLRTSHVFSIGLFKYQSLPKEGIVLRLLDENDNVIETVTTDINGQFVFSSLRPDMNYRVQVVGIDEEALDETELYFVNQKGKVVTAFNDEDPDTYTFNALNPDYFFNIKQLNARETELQITESFKDVSGQFKYQDLPKSGVKLYLLDENDKVIETVYTDEDGNFIFSKLAKESNFYVKLAEEDMALLDQSSFVLMNEENEELEQEVPEDGGFSFRTLPRSLQGMSSLEEDDSPGLSRLKNLTSGAFKFENLPKEGVFLVLLDENDNVIETISTDMDGHFFFSKMEEGKEYKVRVKGYNANNITKTQLYFISRNGHVLTAYNEEGTTTYTFDKLDAAYFNQVGMLTESETKLNLKKAFGNILGQYAYEGLPASGISIGLLDEHDKLVEIVQTNNNGGFAFDALANNSPFSVVVMDSANIDHDKVTIKLSDEDNLPIKIDEQDLHTFKFKTKSTESEPLAVDHMTGDGNSMSALGLNADFKGGKNDLMLNVTKFHFNSVRLSDRDRYHLNNSVLKRIRSSNQPVLIVGYSCDIGDAQRRADVAQQRADEVVKYLVSMGIEESRLETATVSDALIDVESPTTDQRIENRKVEVYHLTP